LVCQCSADGFFICILLMGIISGRCGAGWFRSEGTSMKRWIFLLMFIEWISVYAADPVVSNVRAVQRADSKVVAIRYDVADADGDKVEVSLKVTDGGTEIPATSLVGDIGENIRCGKNKYIEWNAGADWNGNFSSNVVFEVTADDGTWIGGKTKIIFSSNRLGNYDIFIMNSDGTDIRRLTSDSLDEVSPKWSPDGKKIAYLRRRSIKDVDLRVMDVDGGNDRLISAFSVGIGVRLNAWTPDGGALLIVKQPAYSDSHLYLVDLIAGSHSLLLHPSIVSHREIYGASFSSDGKNLIWASQSGSWSPTLEIFTAPYHSRSVNTSAVVRLTNDNKYDDSPVFSPDQSKVAFHHSEASNGYDTPWNIYVINSDGTGRFRLTSTGSRASEPTWSPDGNKIAYHLDGHIWVMTASGTQHQKITEGSSLNYSPDWK